MLRSNSRCYPLSHELLEPRRLLTVSPIEQHFVYLLNWARHDPTAYQVRHGLSIDLSDVASQPPLAINDSLTASSQFHSDEMATYDYFGHQSEVTSDWPNAMARSAGYELPSFWEDDANYIESLAAGNLIDTAAEALDLLIIDEGVPSLGHRRHLLGMGDFYGENREIGVGLGVNASSQYTNYWTIHATRTNPDDRFLTGVVFDDTNNNGVYDVNEGLANVAIDVDGTEVRSNAAGGWSLQVAAGTYRVTTQGGAFQGESSVTVAVGDGNVAVDFISGQSYGIVNFQNQAPPPYVESVEINESMLNPADLAGGPQPTTWQQQRSDLRTIDVRFDRPLAPISVEHVTLINLGVDTTLGNTGTVPLAPRHLSQTDHGITLSFAADELPEGVFELRLSGELADTAGIRLDGNRDGMAGDDFVYAGNASNDFFRLVADWNGDGGVSVFDLSALSYWFGQAAPRFPSYLDLNRDDGATIFDFRHFAANFGTTVVYASGRATVGNGTAVLAAERPNRQTSWLETPLPDDDFESGWHLPRNKLLQRRVIGTVDQVFADFANAGDLCHGILGQDERVPDELVSRRS